MGFLILILSHTPKNPVLTIKVLELYVSFPESWGFVS